MAALAILFVLLCIGRLNGLAGVGDCVVRGAGLFGLVADGQTGAGLKFALRFGMRAIGLASSLGRAKARPAFTAMQQGFRCALRSRLWFHRCSF